MISAKRPAAGAVDVIQDRAVDLTGVTWCAAAAESSPGVGDRPRLPQDRLNGALIAVEPGGNAHPGDQAPPRPGRRLSPAGYFADLTPGLDERGRPVHCRGCSTALSQPRIDYGLDACPGCRSVLAVDERS